MTLTLERLRDVLQQDGTKALAAEVEVEGDREGDMLRVGAMSYRLKGKESATGHVRVKGRVREWTGTPLTIEIPD